MPTPTVPGPTLDKPLMHYGRRVLNRTMPGGIDVDYRHLVESSRCLPGRRGILVDAEQPRSRIEPSIGGAQGAGVAADIKHHPGVEGDALQQVVVRLVGITGHRRRTLR